MEDEQTNGSQKKVGEAIIINKIGFKPKTATRDKDRHYIMKKGSVQEEDFTFVNVYAPNIVGALKHIKQILAGIKGEIDGTTIIGCFNTTFLSMDRYSREKINKATEILNIQVRLH